MYTDGYNNSENLLEDMNDREPVSNKKKRDYYTFSGKQSPGEAGKQKS